MRIAYCIPGFYRPAGMERVLAAKANAFARLGYELSIITTEQKGRAPAFQLEEGTQLRDLGIGYEDNNGGSIFSKLLAYPLKQRRHKRLLRKVLQELKPDITISMFGGEERFLHSLKAGGHKLLEVHFSRFKRLQYGRSGLWAMADRLRSRQDGRIVRRYERFIVLTEEDKGYWGQLPGLRVIPNPSPFSFERPATLESKRVLAVGRLSYQKGFERLLQAWMLLQDRQGEKKPAAEEAALKSQDPLKGWTLEILGGGEELERLQKLAEELGIKASVSLGRSSSNMKEEYLNAAILAMSSRYEGLPMTLIEAQCAGVPAVSFDCKCGPKDIIEDGKTGLLVKEGDTKALAAALERLIRRPEELKAMGAAAFKASERWEEAGIIRQWTALFEEVAGGQESRQTQNP